MKLSSWYDYSQVVYVNMHTPVIIGCPIHGDFKQRPNSHMQGAGCPYCAGKCIFNLKTKEEIKEYWIKHKITGNGVWNKQWQDNNLQELGYPCSPWQSYEMSKAEWTEYVWGKKEFKTKEEIKEYWIKYKITGETSWYKHWKNNNLQEQGYPYNPWQSYEMNKSEWSKYVWGQKKTKGEIKEYWIKYKITGSKVWIKQWQDNNLQELGYPSAPWSSYKMTCIEWTEYVWGKKEFKTKEEIKKYWIENKIIGSNTWYKHWKDNNLQEQGYPSAPWSSYKMSIVKWTEYVWSKNK